MNSKSLKSYRKTPSGSSGMKPNDEVTTKKVKAMIMTKRSAIEIVMQSLVMICYIWFIQCMFFLQCACVSHICLWMCVKDVCHIPPLGCI